MKRKTLLLLAFTPVLGLVQAQQKNTAYAITAAQKGHNNWTEVRLVDLTNGNEVKSVYQSSEDVKMLHARTGRALAVQQINSTTKQIPNKPFATNSAACAFDKKHNRLYYTPMGINELRYIDLNGKVPRVFYFEGESFGALKSPKDVANQITRMVIGADGNGYALTNNADHLIRFTTNRKAEIKDLGALVDDPSNGTASVHSSNAYGGDMVADAKGNLYLIGANRAVFRISTQNNVATFLGLIKGLPRGFSTNGAAVEGVSTVIVSSSNSIEGYYKFDINTLQAEKISAASAVYNASDLANSNLLFEKEKKERKTPEVKEVGAPEKEAEATIEKEKPVADEPLNRNGISVFPNPVTTGMVKIAFNNQPEGRYRALLFDVAGKLVSSQEIVISSHLQVVEYKLPELITKGSYLIRVTGQNNKEAFVQKLLVE